MYNFWLCDALMSQMHNIVTACCASPLLSAQKKR